MGKFRRRFLFCRIEMNNDEDKREYHSDTKSNTVEGCMKQIRSYRRDRDWLKIDLSKDDRE